MSPQPSSPEPWLRGPVPGVPPLLQPAAHALIQVQEETARICLPLSVEQLWAQPSGAASIAFHLQHLARSTNRLLTYARGEALTDDQRRALHEEGQRPETLPDARELVVDVHTEIERALAQLAMTSESQLLEPRYVGKLQLPSTLIGLLFHAAEHASRHLGQITTTARLVAP